MRVFVILPLILMAGAAHALTQKQINELTTFFDGDCKGQSVSGLTVSLPVGDCTCHVLWSKPSRGGSSSSTQSTAHNEAACQASCSSICDYNNKNEKDGSSFTCSARFIMGDKSETVILQRQCP
jgi:hypothetical protein